MNGVVLTIRKANRKGEGRRVMSEKRLLLVDAEAARIARMRLEIDSPTEYADTIHALTPQADGDGDGGEAIEVPTSIRFAGDLLGEMGALVTSTQLRIGEVMDERDALRAENACLRALAENPHAVEAAFRAYHDMTIKDMRVWAAVLHAAVEAVLKEATCSKP